ncbi:phosphotransferase system sugar-specific permease component [Lucifera butyrica]|uniref:Ascorbate-specific PTS system EIIC component n=1 Tax=Lucifera butyrica TaxID=1351585 RepID=A0A498RDZ2_9FIRM|nr:PTS ascorbate transporter subunit IIC [Lucifera butyrica]VBB09714.1 phosphotransferase system sugar-specific permease component [Lucifera butyrica]
MLMKFIEFFVLQLLSQPAILLGLVALIGLIIQKRSIDQIIMGSLKTTIGVVIIGAGAGVISGSLIPLGEILNVGFSIKGVMPTNEAVLPFAIKNFGSMGALVMVGGFIINIILARVTKFKFVYLTGHIMFYVSLFVTAIYVSIAHLSGIPLFVVGSITMGLYFTLMPALLNPYTSKISGGENFTVGHTGDVGYWFSAWIGKYVGNPENSAEKFKLPKSLSFFRDSTASMAVTMVIIFLVAVVAAGMSYVEANVSKGTNAIIFAVMQGLLFAGGVTVVLAGVRMMLSEIIPAFSGISEKLIPGAIPAIDCPVLFPYAPTALIFGFISMFVGMTIGMFVQMGLGALYIILPGIVPAFFAGGTAGIFGNSTGGWKGAIVGPFIVGIILTVGTGYLIPSTGALATTGSTFGDPFYATVGLGFAKLVTALTSLGL